jgi:hypothetical protein
VPIACGTCHARHDTIDEARGCSTRLATRPIRQPKGESFGQTLRRIDAERAAEAKLLAAGLVARAEAIAAKPKPARKVRPADLYKGDESGRCGRCCGTGQFITYIENDVPKGPGGPCFNCAGKGHVTDCGEVAHEGRAQAIANGERTTEACCDRVRNDLYWTYGVRIHWGM